ncbi:MAG: sigma-54 dependent transcriptional regulator [Kiritimatiellia bacterium]|nr:sigma-54 dependent transcriptional regulator [Kiritimatiellia bacterium]
MASTGSKEVVGGVSIAVVDDDSRVAQTIALHLRSLAGALRVYTDPVECLAALEELPADILVTDVDMPGMSGIELMEKVGKACPGTDIIVVTGAASKAVAVEALRAGAFDLFEKPFDPALLLETIKRTARYQAACRERDRYAAQVMLLSGKQAERWGINAFVGQSEQLKDVVKQIAKLQKAATMSVLIQGESGTGKELVARAIHYGGPHASSPFVPVNCSAIPSELVESTLFGHVKGAFTGAIADRKGAFVRADTGTLFLDEIGDMPSEMQTKLLRVLEDGIVTPVGSTKGQQVDVRIVAATNTNLLERVEERLFREDLYFRIAGYNITVPALRDRPGDIPLLANHFADVLSDEMGIAQPAFGAATMTVLERHPFAGNIRELRNVVHAALVECDGPAIEPDHLRLIDLAIPAVVVARAAPVVSESTAELSTLNLAELEQVAVQRALQEADGNMSKAARILGISRPKLYRKVAAGAQPDAE